MTAEDTSLVDTRISMTYTPDIAEAMALDYSDGTQAAAVLPGCCAVDLPWPERDVLCGEGAWRGSRTKPKCQRHLRACRVSIFSCSWKAFNLACEEMPTQRELCLLHNVSIDIAVLR